MTSTTGLRETLDQKALELASGVLIGVTSDAGLDPERARRYAENCISLYLSASMAGPVPEGWKAAPYKSTAEMTNAFSAAVKELQAAGNDPLQFPATLFHAMLAAAPSFPPAEQNDVTPSSSHASHAPAPALPEAKPVADEGLIYALEIGGMGRPYSDVQGALYMNERYKLDPSPDATFRDYGLAHAVCTILNRADDIRAALYVSPNREAATREAVILWRARYHDDRGEEWMSWGCWAQKNGINRYEDKPGWDYEERLFVPALAQQAKPQQEKI